MSSGKNQQAPPSDWWSTAPASLRTAPPIKPIRKTTSKSVVVDESETLKGDRKIDYEDTLNVESNTSTPARKVSSLQSASAEPIRQSTDQPRRNSQPKNQSPTKLFFEQPSYHEPDQPRRYSIEDEQPPHNIFPSSEEVSPSPSFIQHTSSGSYARLMDSLDKLTTPSFRYEENQFMSHHQYDTPRASVDSVQTDAEPSDYYYEALNETPVKPVTLETKKQNLKDVIEAVELLPDTVNRSISTETPDVDDHAIFEQCDVQPQSEIDIYPTHSKPQAVDHFVTQDLSAPTHHNSPKIDSSPGVTFSQTPIDTASNSPEPDIPPNVLTLSQPSSPYNLYGFQSAANNETIPRPSVIHSLSTHQTTVDTVLPQPTSSNSEITTKKVFSNESSANSTSVRRSSIEKQVEYAQSKISEISLVSRPSTVEPPLADFKTCFACQKQNDPEANFCCRCGSKMATQVKVVASVVEEPESPKKPVFPPYPVFAFGPNGGFLLSVPGVNKKGKTISGRFTKSNICHNIQVTQFLRKQCLAGVDRLRYLKDPLSQLSYIASKENSTKSSVCEFLLAQPESLGIKAESSSDKLILMSQTNEYLQSTSNWSMALLCAHYTGKWDELLQRLPLNSSQQTLLSIWSGGKLELSDASLSKDWKNVLGILYSYDQINAIDEVGSRLKTIGAPEAFLIASLLCNRLDQIPSSSTPSLLLSVCLAWCQYHKGCCCLKRFQPSLQLAHIEYLANLGLIEDASNELSTGCFPAEMKEQIVRLCERLDVEFKEDQIIEASVTKQDVEVEDKSIPSSLPPQTIVSPEESKSDVVLQPTDISPLLPIQHIPLLLQTPAPSQTTSVPTLLPESALSQPATFPSLLPSQAVTFAFSPVPSLPVATPLTDPSFTQQPTDGASIVGTGVLHPPMPSILKPPAFEQFPHVSTPLSPIFEHSPHVPFPSHSAQPETRSVSVEQPSHEVHESSRRTSLADNSVHPEDPDHYSSTLRPKENRVRSSSMARPASPSESQTKSGIFSRFKRILGFSASDLPQLNEEITEENDESKLSRKNSVKAHLGKENTFRYDEVKGRWVDGNGDDEDDASIPPPPIINNPSLLSTHPTRTRYADELPNTFKESKIQSPPVISPIIPMAVPMFVQSAPLTSSSPPLADNSLFRPWEPQPFAPPTQGSPPLQPPKPDPPKPIVKKPDTPKPILKKPDQPKLASNEFDSMA